MDYEVIIPPTAAQEPVTLAQLRVQMRQEAAEALPDDALMQLRISAAREWAEQFMGRAIAEQTVELRLPAFPNYAFVLPGGKVEAIVSFTHWDDIGALVPLAPGGYRLVHTGASVSQLYPPIGDFWPYASQYGGANVRYVIGSGPQPAIIKAAVLMLAAELSVNPTLSVEGPVSEVPMGIQRLLQPYRLNMGV